MSEAKHTDGPWCWRGGMGAAYLATERGGALVVLSVVQVESGPDDSWGDYAAIGVRVGDPSRLVPLTPDHPDARLIAAAPDLLAACELVADHLTELADAWERGVLTQRPAKGGPRPNRNREALRSLLAAVAKAKGGA